jgi:dipeptidyl aminopeptidase/acylaminoacyl peptidase
MNADGSNVQQLTNTPLIVDEAPAWSPDGQKIVFQTDRDGNNWEIYVMNVDGSDQKRLTNNPAGDYAPNWGLARILASDAAPMQFARMTLPQHDVIPKEVSDPDLMSKVPFHGRSETTKDHTRIPKR